MEVFNRNTVKIAIDGDENKVIEFSPNDMLLRKRITQFMVDLQMKQAEMDEKAQALDKANTADEGEMPSNIQEVLDFNQEVADYFTGELDDIFGKGSSTMLFGEAGFDPSLMASFMSFVMDKAGAASKTAIEQKLGRPLKEPRKKAEK